MGEKFHRASGVEIPFDGPSLIETFEKLMNHDDGILVVSKTGMAGALVYPAYFNRHTLVAQEIFWWGDGDLLQALESRARTRGAETLSMISLDGLREDAVGRFYRMNGYRPLEHTYIKRL
jgi:hypothetical protein